MSTAQTRSAPLLIKHAVRSLLWLTPRPKALNQARSVSRRYLELAEGLDEAAGKQSVKVPTMTGIDEDMRSWSFYMILEHNRIVNECITAIVCQLARNEELHGAALMDPKHDVMPSISPGKEQVAAFEASVEQHIAEVAKLKELRNTRCAPHPIFGDFDAHKWNGMFSFHLNLHYKQAHYVVKNVSKGSTPDN